MVTGGLTDGEARVQNFYEWRRDRLMKLAGGAFKLAGLMLTPLLAAILDSKMKIDASAAHLYERGIVLTAAAGVLLLARAYANEQEYVLAMRIVAMVRRR